MDAAPSEKAAFCEKAIGVLLTSLVVKKTSLAISLLTACFYYYRMERLPSAKPYLIDYIPQLLRNT